MSNYPFFRAVIVRHYSLEPIPQQLLTLGHHCLQAIHCKLLFLRTVHPSHLAHPLPPSQLALLIASNLRLHDQTQLLHALAQLYLKRDQKNQLVVERDVAEMLMQPQEEAEESSSSGDSFLDDEQESQEREIRRKKRRQANQRVKEREKYNSGLKETIAKQPDQDEEVKESQETEEEGETKRQEWSAEIRAFFKSTGSAKGQLNFFWQLIKTPPPLYSRAHIKDCYFVRVTVKMDNYYTEYSPKQFEGSGQSHNLKQAQNLAAAMALGAVFNSHPHLLPNFLTLKQQRNLK